MHDANKVFAINRGGVSPNIKITRRGQNNPLFHFPKIFSKRYKCEKCAYLNSVALFIYFTRWD